MDKLIAIAEQFQPEGTIRAVQEYGNGNVNDTFLVSCDCTAEGYFILQRINTRVFRKPEWIMLNMRTFTDHVYKRLEKESPEPGRRWETPRIIQTHGGQDYLTDPSGSFWRAISFVDGSRSYERIESDHHAREAGYALGQFQNLISDLDAEKLYDTLEGFHVTPQYLEQYGRTVRDPAVQDSSAQARYCFEFVERRRKWASVLEDARARGELILRPIHGDPKINNIMVDEQSGHAVSIVDLDTVKPGLVHYDIGDCLRSCCNPLGEETEEIEDVRFETGLCRSILQGYLSVASRFLTENDYVYLYDCIRLIAFELGLRFFTDHLNGNVYFKTRHREHNLHRALVQFKLTESIEAQEPHIRAIIADLKRGA